ncbi:acylneuraminate cytidylyltransferase family protein [Citrifermentans bremense]|uniref:acylneuraminate cytidylyltransferase family protein n=1 Tax=Citrifermentans bremense TaxID=60035 RepID=UPI0003F93C3A|nr:acylneuraminate cytidylyltransferase family protein [Citrifermentans bremense]
MHKKNDCQPRCIGIITARGGSKGLPRKNVLPLAGKPLIAWSIEQARQAALLERVIVSTDDEEIAAVARALGAEVPFLRPAELARDATPHIDVIEHALLFLADSEGYRPEYVCTIQPTSPLRTPADLDQMVLLAYEKRADAVIAVSEAHDHPYLVRKMDMDGLLSPFMEAPIPYLRRQDLPPAYFVNGAGFVNRVCSLLEERTFYPPNGFGYAMPMERSLQIDTRLDFDLVEFLLLRRRENPRGGSHDGKDGYIFKENP